MSQQRVLTPGQISELAARPAGLRLSWSPAEQEQITEEFDWTVAAPPQYEGDALRMLDEAAATPIDDEFGGDDW